ncbi:hypothetical protein Ancab_022463 [Ancistrocladus abbreviatus]
MDNNKAITTVVAAEKAAQNGELQKKKKHSAVHLFRAALFMLRGKNKKSKSLATNPTLTRFFGSARPLHIPAPGLPSPPPAASMIRVKSIDEMSESSDRVAPNTPFHESSSAYSSAVSDQMSRYASAMNLQELDDDGGCDEETDNDGYYDGIEGDEMIDAKAEEFIAQFYQQMRLQHIGARYPRQ